jgi:sirohydrochlorin ferrochelatase
VGLTAVLLAHGSPDPRSQAAVHEAAASVETRTGHRVVAAFLDHDPRDLGAVVSSLDPTDDVVVLPLLLSTAFHARVDVPAAVDALDRDVTLLEPVGHPAALLDALLRRCTGAAVVVSAGTRINEERQAFAGAVAAASARTRVPALAAYATGPGRRLEDTTRPGGSTIVPWLLAPGRLLDAVTTAAGGHGCRTVGTGLLDEDVLLDDLAARVSERPVVPGS